MRRETKKRVFSRPEFHERMKKGLCFQRISLRRNQMYHRKATKVPTHLPVCHGKAPWLKFYFVLSSYLWFLLQFWSSSHYRSWGRIEPLSLFAFINHIPYRVHSLSSFSNVKIFIAEDILVSLPRTPHIYSISFVPWKNVLFSFRFLWKNLSPFFRSHLLLLFFKIKVLFVGL